MAVPVPKQGIFPDTWMGYFGLHEIILYIVIILLIGALGGGPVLKALFNAILKIFGHGGSETVVNVLPGGEMAKIPKECEGCGLVVDPSKCAMHQSEHERSLRNEAQIAKIWTEYSKLRDENIAAQNKLRDEMTTGFKEVTASIAESNRTILVALAGGRNGFSKPSRGGRGD